MGGEAGVGGRGAAPCSRPPSGGSATAAARSCSGLTASRSPSCSRPRPEKCERPDNVVRAEWLLGCRVRSRSRPGIDWREGPKTSSNSLSALLQVLPTSAMVAASLCCQRLIITALPGTTISAEVPRLLRLGVSSPTPVVSPAAGSSAARTAARAEASLVGVPSPKLGSISAHDMPEERRDDHAWLGVRGSVSAGVTTSAWPGSSDNGTPLASQPTVPAAAATACVLSI
mmetsp:Transcript_71875/g.222014  ORF Transcript_71875/g.222014 Transcript_71875/m.222014 type:complete len:229 (-) Transcript_71875:2-688(-)